MRREAGGADGDSRPWADAVHRRWVGCGIGAQGIIVAGMAAMASVLTAMVGFALDRLLSDTPRRVDQLALIAMVSAVVGSATLAAGMVRFTRSIVGNLVELVANSGRIRTREPLVEVVSSSKEVGQLAASLEQAADVLGRQERELRTALADAEQASAAKGQFLSRVSHELRTPLNAVLGFGQLLEMDDDLSAEQGEAVEHILRAGRHLLDLIDEVLDVSRIEAGELFLECEVVSAQAAFREALALIRPLAGESGVTIHDDALDDGPELYVAADRQRLLQVLLNLLSNAVKYNHPGGMVIASCDRLDDDTVRLVVSDSGSGIDLADLDRVFAPFDRVGAEQSNVEGTGIGLSLSLHLLEAMGGSIAVDSVVGVGSTFAIDLRQGSPRPATDLTTGPGSFDGAVGVGSAQEPRAWGPVAGRVLYIDDNLPNLDLVVGVLDRRGGVELETTDSGLAGLDLARTRRPDLVLLDLHLPDISGLEVLGRLRDDPVTRAIPVIMISADATMSSREELVAAGALEYLTKPIDVRRLLDRVDEVLGATLSGSEADR
ncbi:MAG: ATP-binding protein [Acidimicrobiales bacterium]